MDVNSIAGSYVSGYETAKAASKDAETKSEKEVKSSQKDTAEGTAAEYIKSDKEEKKVTYDKVNKLTDKQVEELKNQQEASKAEMLKKMMAATLKNQAANYGLSKESQDLITKIFGSVEAGIPPIATTPEEAQKAISEGGAYSVDAVADRIMKMAQALAGDNKENIGKMRDAVKKGFEAAGLDFKDITGEDKLPQICKDTYNEVMKRFDEWEKAGSEKEGTEKAGTEAK